MDFLTAVPIGYTRAVMWLWNRLQNGTAVPTGSGVVIRHENNQYLVTARHVAEACRNRPHVRLLGQPVDFGFSVIASSEQLDVTVLQTAFPLNHDTPRLGPGYVMYGGIGRALGFPLGAEHGIGEMQGRPVPISVPISANWNPGSDLQVTGGYINAGFSGGAVLFPTYNPDAGGPGNPLGSFSIAGIITHRQSVPRHVKMVSGSEVEDAPYLVVDEPSGIFQFTSILAVTRLISNS